MWYVYVDWTLETIPRPFYVGKGTKSRTLDKERNAFHDNVMNKHGIRREIVQEFDDERLAYESEVRLIAEHHTFMDDPSYNGVGTNFTKGGDGGWTPSHETRRKISSNTSDAMKRMPPKSESHRKALSASLMGHIVSENTRKKMSEAARERKPWNKGRTWSNPRHSETMKAKHFHLTEERKNALREGRERYLVSLDYPVACHTVEGTLLHTFKSLREAKAWAASQGHKSTHISDCVAGRRKQTCGYVWKKMEWSDNLTNHLPPPSSPSPRPP